MEEDCKPQVELVITTEHTEHTEKEPDCLVSSFRAFSVFRGSLIGSCTDRVPVFSAGVYGLSWKVVASFMNS
jgi:hypothetical protein